MVHFPSVRLWLIHTIMHSKPRNRALLDVKEINFVDYLIVGCRGRSLFLAYRVLFSYQVTASVSPPLIQGLGQTCEKKDPGLWCLCWTQGYRDMSGLHEILCISDCIPCFFPGGHMGTVIIMLSFCAFLFFLCCQHKALTSICLNTLGSWSTERSLPI